MATKRGPTKGARILVELPKELADPNRGNLISIKQGVAKVLGFEPVSQIPQKIVKWKVLAKDENGQYKQKEVQREHLRRGSYRRRSVKLLFEKPVRVEGSTGTYKSLSMPIPRGVSIADVVKYFNSGAGKTKKVIGLVTPAGRKIQWAAADLNAKV